MGELSFLDKKLGDMNKIEKWGGFKEELEEEEENCDQTWKINWLINKKRKHIALAEDPSSNMNYLMMVHKHMQFQFQVIWHSNYGEFPGKKENYIL